MKRCNLLPKQLKNYLTSNLKCDCEYFYITVISFMTKKSPTIKVKALGQ